MGQPRHTHKHTHAGTLFYSNVCAYAYKVTHMHTEMSAQPVQACKHTCTTLANTYNGDTHVVTAAL